MSRLATELLRLVSEKKETAQDEMGVPKYGNLNTPNNHVGNTSNATKERPASGLGDRKDKHPTADVGSAGKEKRDMEGPKQKPKRMTEQVHPAMRELGIAVQGGNLSFKHPISGQYYDIPYRAEDPDAEKAMKRFVLRLLKNTPSVDGVFKMLMSAYEDGIGGDPYNTADDPERDALPTADLPRDKAVRRGDPYNTADERGRLAAGLGEDEGGAMLGHNIMSTMNAAVQSDEQGNPWLHVTSPDRTAAVMVPFNPLRKAINTFVRDPDNNIDTAAAADKLFKALARSKAAKAAQPNTAGRAAHGSAVKGKGAPQAPAGLSLVPMDGGDAGGAQNMGAGVNPYQRARVAASVGESAHKQADGEMDKPSVSHGNPAKTAKLRGKQNDEPKNKGNPGSSKEEKGQKKQQFSMSPKHTTGGMSGENEHKSMKKMHEGIAGLEQMLGVSLSLNLTEAVDIGKEILHGYIEAALWASTDESDESGGNPLDDNYDSGDLAPETLQTMRGDVADFLQSNKDLILQAMQMDGYSAEHVGHDFWLTRNGHGAGFWDRGLGRVGDELTQNVKPYGEAHLYIGDDGLIYQG